MTHPCKPFGPSRPLFTRSETRPRTPVTLPSLTPISIPHPLLKTLVSHRVNHIWSVTAVLSNYIPTKHTGALDPFFGRFDNMGVASAWPLMLIWCTSAPDIVNGVACFVSLRIHTFVFRRWAKWLTEVVRWLASKPRCRR
jgi:hypothetical protein